MSDCVSREAEWIKERECSWIPTKCSNCGNDIAHYIYGFEWDYTGDLPNYCPTCGYKMTNATKQEDNK